VQRRRAKANTCRAAPGDEPAAPVISTERPRIASAQHLRVDLDLVAAEQVVDRHLAQLPRKPRFAPGRGRAAHRHARRLGDAHDSRMIAPPAEGMASATRSTRFRAQISGMSKRSPSTVTA
jgi:hypothetical protein